MGDPFFWAWPIIGIGAIIKLLVLSGVVFAVGSLLPAAKIKSFATAIMVALVCSVFNFLFALLIKHTGLAASVKPPILLGLILILANAVMLWLTTLLMKDFKIKGFGWTLVASLLITVAYALIIYFIPSGWTA